MNESVTVSWVVDYLLLLLLFLVIYLLRIYLLTSYLLTYLLTYCSLLVDVDGTIGHYHIPVARKFLKVEVWLHAFCTSALDGSEWSASLPSSFSYGEEPPVLFDQGAVLAPESVWMRGYCSLFTAHRAPTPYSTIFRQKLLLPQLGMKLQAFPGTLKFTTARDSSLSWATWMQSALTHSIAFLKHIF